MSSDALAIEVLDAGDEEDLHLLEAAWRDIQNSGGVAHPMYSWQWVQTWCEEFGEGCSLRAVVAWRRGVAVAIAPVARRSVRLGRLFRYRRLDLMGTGEDEADEVFSEYVDWPVRPDLAPGVAEQVAERLLEEADGWGWDDLMAPRIQPNAVARRALIEAARSRRLRVQESRAGACPYVALPGDVDGYDRNLSSNRRQQLRRGIRGLEIMGEVGFRRSETLDEAVEDLARLGRLHRDHWHGRGKEGAFASERFGRFHRRFIERTFPLGWPEIWTLSVDGRAMACLYNIRYGDRIAFYQCGIRALSDQRIRTGMIAHYYAIREAIRSGATEYDFLIGDARYKRSLGNAERDLVTLRLSRRSLKERTRRLATRLARRLRRLKAGGRGGRR